jgi:hypothetical protein
VVDIKHVAVPNAPKVMVKPGAMESVSGPMDNVAAEARMVRTYTYMKVVKVLSCHVLIPVLVFQVIPTLR